MHAAGRSGEQPACDVRRRAQQAMFDETEKNFAEPELALLNRRSIQVLNSEFGFAVLNSCLLFRSPRACQYFLSLFASANTVPGVIDFRLFFRSQVPRERWAFLFCTSSLERKGNRPSLSSAYLDSDPAAYPAFSAPHRSLSCDANERHKRHSNKKET